MMLVELARRSVEQYVATGMIAAPPEPLPSELARKAGVFVCIKKRGQLRGCVGTIEPKDENLAREIIHNAIAAATKDSRFPPLTADELKDLAYSVDVLTLPEKVSQESELDPKVYGVIVKSGWRRGLLLPDLEGVESAAEQIRIARLKAGIGAQEPCEMFRFRVERFGES